jgi:hypothetical protein
VEPQLAHHRWSPAEIVRHRPIPVIWQFVGLLIVLAGVSLAIPPFWRQPPQVWLSAFVVLTALSVALEFSAVSLPHEGSLSVATITHLATLILVPAPFAALSVAGAVAVEEIVMRRPVVKVAFNVSSYAVTASLTSLAVGLIGNPWQAAYTDEPRLAVIMIVAVVVYHLCNKVLTAAILALATGRRFGFLLRVNTRTTGLPELGAGALGSLFALLWTIHPLWTALLAIPTAVISRTLGYVKQLEAETRTAVRSLAEVIDHRDPHTAHHSERVAAYAVELARRFNLDDDLVELIDQAAGVHDLGKIGVPDSVLLKPGPLTESERTTMWLHTEIGARILNHYELFRDGAKIVLHHHERWDGKGYPAGLAGTAIPLGSRIVAVADAFDAMTSNRPYRQALSVSEAIERLADGSGTQWDPDCVDVFKRLVLEGGLGPAIATQAAATVTPEAADGAPRAKRDPVEVER